MVLGSSISLLCITLCYPDSLPNQRQDTPVEKAHDVKLGKLSHKISHKFPHRIHIPSQYCLLFLTPPTVKKKTSADFPTLVIFFLILCILSSSRLCSAPAGIDTHKSKLRGLLSPSCLPTCFYTTAQTHRRSTTQPHVLFPHFTPPNHSPHCLHHTLQAPPKEISFSPNPSARKTSIILPTVPQQSFRRSSLPSRTAAKQLLNPTDPNRGASRGIQRRGK